MNPEFKVIYIQPKFISKEERLRLMQEIQSPNPQASSSTMNSTDSLQNSRSRSPRRERIPSSNSELPAIKNNFLKNDQKKPKPSKPSDKFQRALQFEWDPSEDTTQIYHDDLPKVAPRPLFGKGKIGGIEPENSDINTRNARDVIKKELYEMTIHDWRILKEEYEINTKGSNIPNPIRNWDESDLPPNILKSIYKMRYSKPMPIQMQAIPIGLECRDMIAIAPTGSGKSAAYLLPMISYLQTLPPLDDVTALDGPYAIILAPTRELAQQIYEEAKNLAQYTRVKSYCVVGGKEMERQALELGRGFDCIVATPGRVLDCLERQVLVLNQCHWVVIDEADKMILLNFEETLEKILNFIPKSNLKSSDEGVAHSQELETKQGDAKYRVTHLFSATMDPFIERIWKEYLRNPAYVRIGDLGSNSSQIQQSVLFLNPEDKRKTLTRLLKRSPKPIIIFLNHKKEVDNLTSYLERQGYHVGSLHGGKSQTSREITMENFKRGRVDILVATDLAARGIDVEDVQQVINYDCPKLISEYEHRIGRTGRCKKRGLATTLITPNDEEILPDLKTFLERNKQVVPLELKQHARVKLAEEYIT